jgi:ABC-type lipoprotein export system ATPase subunit
MSKRDLLKQIDFGHRIAEEEGTALTSYFVETDNWRRLVNGEVDVVYGPKGSGKSALYALLVARTNDLFDRKTLLVPAENPRGTPGI